MLWCMDTTIILIIVAVIVFLVGTVIANGLLFREHYADYAKSQQAKGKRTSKLRFLLYYGLILNPAEWLESRNRPRYYFVSLLAAAILISKLVVALILE